MTKPRRVTLTQRAAREIVDADDWWRRHRPHAADTLRAELARSFQLIAAHPSIGARSLDSELDGVRRIHLSKVHYHLYYRLSSDRRAVEVLALWHTRRGTGPGS